MRDMRLALCAVVFVCLSGFAIAQSTSTQWKTFDFPGAIETGGTSITSFGDIGGRYITADGVVHGFVWREGQYTSIDFPGASSTEGTWLNDAGEIVGAYNNNGNHAFLLQNGQFTTIDYPGHGNTIATSIGAMELLLELGPATVSTLTASCFATALSPQLSPPEAPSCFKNRPVSQRDSL